MVNLHPGSMLGSVPALPVSASYITFGHHRAIGPSCCTSACRQSSRHGTLTNSLRAGWLCKQQFLRRTKIRLPAGVAVPVSKNRLGLTPTTINVVKNLAGSVMLSLPEAAARETGLGSSCMVIVALVAAGAWQFALIGEACEAVEQDRKGEDCGDFQKVWANMIGVRSARVVDVLVFLYALATCVFYIPMTHALCAPLCEAMGVPTGWLGAPLKGIIVLILFRLGQLRSFKSMTWTSSLGNSAVILSLGVVLLRSLDGSYGPGGCFHGGAALHHVASSWSVGPSTALLAMRLTYAMSCHYNAPRYYAQLDRRSAARHRRVGFQAFAVAGLIFLTLTVCGVLTFGASNCHVPILSSYAVSDPLASLARWMMVISSITIYPLIFSAAEQPCNRLMGTFSEGKEITEPDKNRVMTLLSSMVCLTGFLLRDLGVFVSLMGAFFCAAFVWIMPAILGLATIGKLQNGLAAQCAVEWLALRPWASECGSSCMGLHMSFVEYSD
eukprot:CAMPEP_0204594218 /NCGR_PEP_ID=MMETSP0661-20131031/51949_1 /ASSEMBLY_ACC=CAM_ASM_000606 /TAXON_ID=109239 /ORGANISM="Alexandrium margalefi, Strain AMGDE01CS-322" /LENGTH=496 /DNA_ID=CAMNT_0051604591 /DNA_START=29 /DNA_END=1520 /DNA_ORIENTATION=+